jgi:hypothetical protein
MWIKRAFFLISLFFMSLPQISSSNDAAFLPGEKLTFQLRWEFISAGEATLKVEPMAEINGQPSYHFVMQAKTNSFLDLIYKVRDRIDSYTDTDMTRSLYYKKNQREGRHRRKVTVAFDWDSNRARYSREGREDRFVDLLEGTFDPLGIFYFVRSSNLDDLETIERPVSDGKKCVVGIGSIIRRETVTVPAGTFDTILIEPNLKDVGGVFKKSKDSNVLLWVTADSRHIPVKIQSKVAIGSFIGELTKAEFPGPS